jgi:hypothetical protein
MHLERRGVRLCGTVATLDEDPDAHPCDRHVRILPDGPATRIRQALGSGSRGCRLDPASIESLAIDVERRLAGSDILVVNKFGKQESLGRGLCSAIVRAADLRIPVLVGVNALNLSALLDFTAGEARTGSVRLPSDVLAAKTARCYFSLQTQVCRQRYICGDKLCYKTRSDLQLSY